MAKSDVMICPTCEREFDIESTPAPPFCSRRCREIDLGRWLNEGYSVPAARQDDEDDELPPDGE